MILLKRLIDNISNMRIVQKLIIGYVLLIVIPFMIFGFSFYKIISKNFADQYKSDQNQLAEQAYHNFEIELSKVESIYSVYQNNQNLIEYIGGFYQKDWEMVYNYQRFIRPTFSFTYLSNPVVQNFTIYKHDLKTLQFNPNLINFDGFLEHPKKDEILSLPSGQGIWTYEAASDNVLPLISYTQKLYNEGYTRELGFLHVTATKELLNAFFQSLAKENSRKWLLDRDFSSIYKENVSGWKHTILEDTIVKEIDTELKSFYIGDGDTLVTIIPIDRLGLTLVDISHIGPVANLKAMDGWVLTGSALLLILLSLIYFGVASSLALRIIRFSSHLKQVPDLKFASFPESSKMDEIGFLVISYNKMIKRMEDMGKRVHRTEMLRKDAEIKMLQAQINPHFLYNTLESMRMMALMKNDEEIAEAMFTLGQLLRYSIAKNEGNTLQDEVDNVLDYIAIHKVRMGDRLHFELDVEGELTTFKCPKFILQPLVENSIQHGLSKVRKQGIIRLELKEMLSSFVINITNNGEPIAPERLVYIREILAGDKGVKSEFTQGQRGIGLVNVQERIKAHFGEASGITVESDVDNGTTFQLCLDKKGGGDLV